MSSTDSSYAASPSNSPTSAQPRSDAGPAEPEEFLDDDLEPITLPEPSAPAASDEISSESEFSTTSDSDPGDPSRPNKRQKTLEEWLQHNEDAIILAKAEDKLRSQDLAIHLYNVHRLHVLDVPRKEAAKSWRMGETEARPSWTAWPLPAKDVPREREGALQQWVLSADAAWTTVSQDSPKSSAKVLEEIIISLAAKKARERFAAREWEDRADDYETVYSYHYSTYPKLSRKKSKTVRDAQTGYVTTESGTESNHTYDERANQKRHGIAAGQRASTSGPGPQPAPEEMISGIKVPSLLDVEPPTDEFLVEKARLVPGPLTDEEHITALLQRPARHVLSELDALLTVLHEAKIQDKRIVRETVLFDEDQPEIQTKRGSRPVKNSSVGYGPYAEEGQPLNKNEAYKYYRHRGLRDWSVVLGFASLAGWPAATVQRARARCEKLFDQKMDFRRSVQDGGAVSSDEEDVDEEDHESKEEVSPVKERSLREKRALIGFKSHSARGFNFDPDEDPGELLAGTESAPVTLRMHQLDAVRLRDGLHEDWFMCPLKLPQKSFNFRKKDNTENPIRSDAPRKIKDNGEMKDND